MSSASKEDREGKVGQRWFIGAALFGHAYSLLKVLSPYVFTSSPAGGRFHPEVLSALIYFSISTLVKLYTYSGE